jgi:hypothetical protein
MGRLVEAFIAYKPPGLYFPNDIREILVQNSIRDSQAEEDAQVLKHLTWAAQAGGHHGKAN